MHSSQKIASLRGNGIFGGSPLPHRRELQTVADRIYYPKKDQTLLNTQRIHGILGGLALPTCRELQATANKIVHLKQDKKIRYTKNASK